MLLESLVVCDKTAPESNLFSDSSFGEDKAYSFPPRSSIGAYSLRNEFSLATLVRLLLSRLVRRFSMLVRRLSVGDEEDMNGRCWSRLDRFDWRRRGGGGGGGIVLPVLSFETTRGAFRFEVIDEVRRTLVMGEAGSESKVLRRDEDGPGTEGAVRTEFERCGSSELDEFALDDVISVNLAPCLDRGGGGGGFATDVGSLSPKLGLWRTALTESDDDSARDELLRNLFPAVELRS
jgi:hypothetical protein